MLLFAYNDNLISVGEFFFYELNKSRNLKLPHWNYDQCNLDLFTDDECTSEFRFYKRDVHLFAEVLQIPDQIWCYDRVIVDGIETLCIFLKIPAYPCTYSDMLTRFVKWAVRFNRAITKAKNKSIFSPIYSFLHTSVHCSTSKQAKWSRGREHDGSHTWMPTPLRLHLT